MALAQRQRQPEAKLLRPIIRSIVDLTDTLYLLDLEGFPDDFDPQPGQFLHIKVNDEDDPLLRRPISLQSYTDGVVRLLIREVGIGTQILHGLREGDTMDALGPLGTAFSPIGPGDRVLMVGGGVGVAPLLCSCHAADPASEIDFCFGMATAPEIQGIDNFEADEERVRFHLSTDDGTAGYHGFCTEVAARLLSDGAYTKLFTCGPWIMMDKAFRLVEQAGIPAETSLEVQMGCGLGACLACVYETVEGEFIRSCIDGPVVDGYTVVWER